MLCVKHVRNLWTQAQHAAASFRLSSTVQQVELAAFVVTSNAAFELCVTSIAAQQATLGCAAANFVKRYCVHACTCALTMRGSTLAACACAT